MKLFAYGTLLDPYTQEMLFGRQLEMVDAELKGWKLGSFNSGIRYILPGPYWNVEGKILLDLTDEDMARADQYEGDSYQRVRVIINGEPVYTYRLREGLDPRHLNVSVIQ